MSDKLPTKVLFLDIDGVVNCATTFKMGARNDSPYPLDPEKAFMIGRIVLYTGCDVVLSSSWRHSKDGRQAVTDKIVPFIDVTPNSDLVNYEDKPRGNEIQQWLDEHPSVQKYAILDDDSDMLGSQLENFFHTTWANGLTEEITQKVIKHLGEI